MQLKYCSGRNCRSHWLAREIGWLADFVFLRRKSSRPAEARSMLRPSTTRGDMQTDGTVKGTVTRCWPALCWVGLTALSAALVGLPLQPNGPPHHWLLAYLVVGSVIAVSLVGGLQPGGMLRRALALIATSIAFLLNLSAFNTLVAKHDASLEFIAALIGFQTQTLRAVLVLLLATFVSLLTSLWHHVTGLGEVRWGPSDGDTISLSEQGHSTAAAAAPQKMHKAPTVRQPRFARAIKTSTTDIHHPPETVLAGMRRDGITSDPYEPSNAAPRRHTGPPRAVRCAIPVVAFVVACAWPLGGSMPCYLGTEHARFVSATDRAPATSRGNSSPAIVDAPLTLPNASAQSSSQEPGHNKRKDGRRAERGPRTPP
jgi:hypothetical protein